MGKNRVGGRSRELDELRVKTQNSEKTPITDNLFFDPATPGPIHNIVKQLTLFESFHLIKKLTSRSADPGVNDLGEKAMDLIKTFDSSNPEERPVFSITMLRPWANKQPSILTTDIDTI